MTKYVLTFGEQTMLIDSETLDPGELTQMKSLGHCAHFSLDRLHPDIIPDMDHDPLDDVAKEIVATGKSDLHGNYTQAKKRVIERGLQ